MGSLVFVGTAAAVYLGQRDARPSPESDVAAARPEPAASLAPESSAWEEGVISWREPGFVQEYTLHGGGALEVHDRSLNGSTGQWESVTYSSSVTLDPVVFSSGGRDDFAIGGVDRSTGEAVIERLRLVSSSAFPGSTSAKTFVRSEISRGALAQPLVALGVDLDHRFLLVLCGTAPDRQLYRVPMQADASPALLHDAISQPMLNEAWMLSPLDHVSLGRIWLISGMTDEFDGETMVLVDEDNVGLFESPPIIDDYSSLVESGLLEDSAILDPFIRR